ncbi:MFS transporter [Propylenella binzhouense]|uniref:MFS transporter n=1 Tax=Propylenella binzhouense TaxID=2555902 RepID=A0A964T1L3_9HYPH|nr:MFS transporter [Propylenella binzhouense]MYZ46708.1 MFS transporter [Propylenella binzhouense]
MTEAAAAGSGFDNAKARRNAVVLAAAQAIAGASSPINIAVSSLAGAALLTEHKELATAPVTAFVVGTACGTIPAGLLMRRFGRRIGLMSGMLSGVAGGLIAAAAMAWGSFAALVLGCFLMGSASAFVQQFRFAAADAATPAFRPKAISWVLAGGMVSAVIGPQAAIHFGGAVGAAPFAGAYLAAAALLLLGGVLLVPLDAPPPSVRRDRAVGRPLREIAVQPRFILAVGCGIVTYAMMNLVMTAAPLAMVYCGHPADAAALGIQWHVLAMFAPSFVTGGLITRFGADRVVAAGLLLLIGCALVALGGVDLMHFWGALVLLGLGWNLGFIGASSMVGETYHPEEKERVQSFNDLLVFGFVAVASLVSGGVLVRGGWDAVNMVVLPTAVTCLVALAWFNVHRGKAVGPGAGTP